MESLRFLKALLRFRARMFDMAKAYATNENTKDKQRQVWVRIMAYIGQVMNSLSKTLWSATQRVPKSLTKNRYTFEHQN